MAYSLARLLLLVITPNNGLAVVALQGGEDQQRQNCTLVNDTWNPAQQVYKTDEITAIPLNTTDNNSITVYPNPSENSFYFVMLQPDCGVTILILYDVNGRHLYSASSENGQWVWDAGSANAGIYYYHIVGCDDKRYTGKLVKY